MYFKYYKHEENHDIVCGKMVDNPNNGYTNFDTFWSSIF